MSENVEKSRSDYVAQLEQRVIQLQQQLDEYKPIAEHWRPIVSGAIEPTDNSVRVTLAFAGKRVTATIGHSSVQQNTVHDLSNSIANTLAESMLVAEITKLVRPEVERLVAGVKHVDKAGQW